MGFKKTGEVEVYKKETDGFTKKVAQDQEAVRYTVDDLVEDADKGIDPYQEQEDESAEVVE